MVHASNRLLKNPDFNEQKFEQLTLSSQLELSSVENAYSFEPNRKGGRIVGGPVKIHKT